MKKLTFLILAFSFLTLTSTCFAQEWVRTYKNVNGGLKDGEDKANDMVIDSDGFIIVTGYVSDCETGTDICVIKYEPDGDTLWVKKFKGPGASEDKAYAITVDDLDNIYITGITRGNNNCSDIITIKYSPNGDTLWHRTFDGTAHVSDKGSVICIDASRNIYVAGYTTSQNHEDYVIIKYNSAGVQQWFKTYDGSGHNTDIATSIAVNNSITDCEDFVVVSGYSRTGQTETTEDIVTISYRESDGQQLWLSRVNGSESGNVEDKAYAITVDKNNVTFVTGYSQRSASGKDIIIIAYDYNGEIKWKRFYEGTYDDIGYSILATQDNNVLVCGSSKSSNQYGSENYITLDYHSNNGNPKWNEPLNGPGNSIDVANSMVLSKNSQSIYVTGYSKSSQQSPRYDILTVKYKLSNGELQDSTRFNTTGFDESNASAIALNDEGDIYISGFSSPLDPNKQEASVLRKKTCMLTLKYPGTLDFQHGNSHSGSDNIEKNLTLNQNFPNPFNPTTVISFIIPKDAFTKVTIYDMLGKEVKTLVSENLSAGVHTVQFDGSNLSSGIYFYELNVNGIKNIKKMMLLK